MVDKNLRFEYTEKLDASDSQVWEALTNKDMVKQYFFGTEVNSKWEKGSTITFTGIWEGKEYIDSGKILEIEIGKMLKYDYLSSFSGLEDKPENYSIITYKLEQAEGGTLLHVTQEGFKNQESRDHSEQGWKMVISNMKKLLEEN
jgi:uncharacterized protein YndB with AHSA1/START domain